MCSGQPVRRQSAMSRAIWISSPSAGQPSIPRRVEATPSFTCPLADKVLVLAMAHHHAVELGGVVHDRGHHARPLHPGGRRR